ncbi:MAG: rod shape-determining protein MreC [Alistipes sp.]|nr:rod shape-determining protein MreC [Alistipes sp.]
MRRLIEFIRSTYVFLLFIALEAVALNCYAHSTPYTRAKLLTRASRIVGGINGAFTEAGRYFSLRRENDILLGRIAELENRLSAMQPAGDESPESDSDAAELSWGRYVYMPARVVSMSVNRNDNFMVIDKGMDDGVKSSMAAVSPDGAMVGYVVDCSERYSIIMPVLNTSFRASGRILNGGGHSGSIKWNGHGIHNVSMSELSKYAEPHRGDTIVSTGYSTYFPEGVTIGFIRDFEINETRTAYELDVELATDISALRRVVLVDFDGHDEIEALKSAAKENGRI